MRRCPQTGTQSLHCSFHLRRMGFRKKVQTSNTQIKLLQACKRWARTTRRKRNLGAKHLAHSCDPCSTGAPWSIAQHSLNAVMQRLDSRQANSFRRLQPAWLPSCTYLGLRLHRHGARNPALPSRNQDGRYRHEVGQPSRGHTRHPIDDDQTDKQNQQAGQVAGGIDDRRAPRGVCNFYQDKDDSRNCGSDTTVDLPKGQCLLGDLCPSTRCSGASAPHFCHATG
jgi:hypothetical protein